MKGIELRGISIHVRKDLENDQFVGRVIERTPRASFPWSYEVRMPATTGEFFDRNRRMAASGSQRRKEEAIVRTMRSMLSSKLPPIRMRMKK